MRPKSVADEQRQLALAIKLSKRHRAEDTRRGSRVGIRVFLLFCFVFVSLCLLRQQPKTENCGSTVSGIDLCDC